jgi:hypothetical protein
MNSNITLHCLGFATSSLSLPSADAGRVTLRLVGTPNPGRWIRATQAAPLAEDTPAARVMFTWVTRQRVWLVVVGWIEITQQRGRL